MRKQTKIAAMVSAAALLAIGASVTSLAAWSYDESIGEYVYKDKDGDPEEGWHRYTNGAWCFADEDGVMVRNSLVGQEYLDDFSGRIYYVGEYASREKEMWVEVTNEDDLSVGRAGEEEIVPEFLYYYIGSGQVAYKADEGDGYVAKSGVWTTGAKANKGIFLFNEDGHMMLGWQGDTYYCVTLDDLYDNLIEIEGGYVADKYVEGQALTGWAKFPSDDPDEDGTWYYFGTDGKKVTGVKKLSWLGSSAYYKFDEDGQMVTDVPTFEPATVGSADDNVTVGIYSYSSEGLVNGNDWYYDSANDKWYYIVNLKDSKRNVTRGVIFNAQVGSDGKVNKKGTKLARVIDGKTFIFGSDGAMLTGVVEVKAGDCNVESWNGVTCKKLAPGTYYCSEKKNSGHRGEVTEGQITYDDVAGESVTSYFGVNGLETDAMINGYVYDEDGYLVVATEDTYTAYTTGADFKVLKKSGKTLKEDATLTASLKGGQTLIVNKSGKAKETARTAVSVDGIAEYTVSGYVGTKQ